MDPDGSCKMIHEVIYSECSKFMYINGIKTFVVEKGKGSPVILIHGFASSSYTWKHIIEPLSKHFHVYSLDLKGFGASEKSDGEYDLEVFTNQIKGLMEEERIRNAVLIGNSLGGQIAVNMAINNSHMVSGLVLIDSAGYPVGNEFNVNGFFKFRKVPVIGELFGHFISKKAVRSILEDIYFDSSKITDEVVEAYYKPLKSKGGYKAVLTMLRKGFLKESIHDRIKNIDKPTLIIWGINDSWIPVSNAYKFNDDIKGSELLIIPECGHVPQEEQPSMVDNAIINFIKGTSL